MLRRTGIGRDTFELFDGARLKTRAIGAVFFFALLCGVFAPVSLISQTAEQAIEGRQGAAIPPTPKLYFNVDDAITNAIASNLSLKRNELEVASLRHSSDTSFNLFYPTASANATLSLLNEEPQIPASPRNSLSTNIQLQLTIGAQQIVAIEQASLRYQSGAIGYQKARQELAGSVRKAFYNLILLQENIEIAKESLRLAKEREQQTQARYDVGLIDEYTLLNARVAAENRVPQLTELESLYRDASRRFNLAVGVPIDAPVDNVELVGEIAPDIYTIDDARLIADLPTLNLDVQDLALSEKITRSALNSYVAQFIPSLVLGYSFAPIFQNEIFDDPDLFNEDNWTVGGGFTATLAIPLGSLLPFSSAWVNISNTRRQIESVQAARKELNDNLIIQAYSLIDTLQRIRELLKVRDLNAQLAERALQVANEGYKAGIREILEVRDAQNQLDSAQLNFLNEKYNYISSQVDLALLLGIGVEELASYRATN